MQFSSAEVVKQFQIKEENLNTHIENARNNISQMKAEFGARDAHNTASIMAAHQANIRLEKMSMEYTEALRQVYERLMGASALIQPLIQEAFNGATEDVYELSSEEDVQVNETPNADPQAQNMEPNVEKGAPSAEHHHVQHHVLLKAEALPVPTEQPVAAQIQDVVDDVSTM